MAVRPDQDNSQGFNVVTRTVKFFRIKGGRLSQSEDQRLSESVKTSGLDGRVVTSVDGLELGMYLDCGCLCTSPKTIAGQCQYPGCGALVCQAHSGQCEGRCQGGLVCRRHLREVEVEGKTRTYCERCAWRYAFWELLLGL